MTKAAKTKAKAAEKAPKKTFSQSLRENIEAIIVAIILALIIRHFSVEAFEIPTGSMAPILYGLHVRSTCPSCSTTITIGVPEDWAPRHNPVDSRTVRCPVCEDTYKLGQPELAHGLSRRAPFVARKPYGGHKILVNKFHYKLFPVERWDVIVFRFSRDQNYIKRCVGLPGERIEIRYGDIYANGEIMRKPDRVQKALWMPVADSDLAEAKDAKHPAWVEMGPDQRTPLGGTTRAPQWKYWRKEAKGSGSVYTVNAQGETASLSFERDCDDYYAYGLLSPRSYRHPNLVPDRRLEFVCHGAAGYGGLTVFMSDGAEDFEFVLPVKDPRNPKKAFIRRSGTVAAESPEVGIPYATPVHLAFEICDDQARVLADGEEAIRLEYQGKPPGDGRYRMAIVARDLAAELRSIRVYRDVYYTMDVSGAEYATKKPFRVPEDGYFALGDHSPNSSDGRVWGYVPEKNVLGRAFVVFWPALPWNWQVKLIR